MAAYDIQKHFKGLRVDTGRRRSRRDPFADPFEDDSDDDKDRRSRSKTKQSPSAAAEKEKPPSTTKPPIAAPAKSTTSTSPKAPAVAVRRDSEDEFLDAPKRTDRRPSPAPAQLASLRVSDGAGRRGSLDQGLQSKGLLPRNVQTTRAPRSAVAQAAGTLAYLDDSSEEEEETRRSSRTSDRHPSPAPRKQSARKQSDPVEPALRSPTPKGGVREAIKEPALPPKHTVASPFAGTKYLQDSESDSDEEAISSRSNSIDGPIAPDAQPGSPDKNRLEVKRVDKPKAQNGGGMSWRAFSAGRAEQRNTELEALQASLRSRGKSISFGTHAVTDDGNRVPIAITSDQIFAGTRGPRKGRGKSPPRRDEDAQPDDDEADGTRDTPVGVYDPTQFKTNPFTGEFESKSIQGGDRQANVYVQENPSAEISALQMTIPSRMGVDPEVPMVASLTSASTISSSNDAVASPVDTGGLENSTGSLTGKTTVSPPQTIPEGRTIDQPLSPVLSPSEEILSPLSRNSSARSIRIGSRPTRIPNATRRQSRRSTSANPSPSPAHAFLSSWTRDTAVSEPAAESKPDDAGQAIGPDNEYIIGRLISRGGFGVVKEVHSIRPSGEPVVRAVKIVRKSISNKDEAENERAQQEFEHEVSIWRHLKHRHVLELIVVFDTDFATFCVMELNVGGTLHELVRRRRASAPEKDGHKGLDPKMAKSYAFQLACALRYLHEDIRVCHRDVKLENCLIDMSGPDAEIEGGFLRLCDFGLADFLHSEGSADGNSSDHLDPGGLSLPASRTHARTASSVIGTLEYASPKGLSVNRKLFETAGDVWAFGVIVYALCTGELPFRHAMPAKTVEMILQADWDDHALLNAATGGGEVKELVQGCLERDIDMRLTIGEALRSQWFAGCEHGDGEGGKEKDIRASGMWG